MQKCSQKDIISVLFTKTAQWQKDLKDIFKGATPFTLVEACGAVKSILDWAKTTKLDRDQRHAFKVITASFVLSYYREVAENNGNLTAQDNTAWKPFIEEKINEA